MDLATTKLGRVHCLPARGQRYEPGTLIVGKYRLECRLGEGGMGTVWLARNEALDAPVALKLIRSGMQNEETVERLLREARVEAKLKHPNIVRVFDFGHTDLGDAFIVMEVLDGLSLGELLSQRHQLGAVEAVQLVLPVIAALCHAHEHGVVHRDIKPQNIFVDRSGLGQGTKLLDFGIAKLADRGFDSHITQSGRLLGSPAYMAPEQANGSTSVDHRADIWATCVILYEAISGRPAFSGEGYVVLRKVLDDRVLAFEDTGAGEPALWRILSRGLETDPSQRFQLARELGTALAQWLCSQGQSEDIDGNSIARHWSVAASSSAFSSPPKVRPRRYVEMLELPGRQTEALGSVLLRRGKRRRAATDWRVFAASAFGFAILLWPSQIGREPAERTSRGAEQSADSTSERPLRGEQAARGEPPVADGRRMGAEAHQQRVQPEPSHAKHSSPRITEASLGLKVPY